MFGTQRKPGNQTIFNSNAIIRNFRNKGLLAAPTLFYYNTEPSIELSREAAIAASFSFDTRRPNSFLQIILVQFALNGTFLGMATLSDSDLNACPQQKGQIRFGAFYRIRCFLQLQQLLSTAGKEPIFSDPYLTFLDEHGKTLMYAMPILNENIRRNGEFVNRLARDELSNSKWILTRRIYFVDGVSLNNPSIGQNSTIIRFPEEISIKIQIQVGDALSTFVPF